jgi:lysophospholipase L1-like esterase
MSDEDLTQKEQASQTNQPTSQQNTGSEDESSALQSFYKPDTAPKKTGFKSLKSLASNKMLIGGFAGVIIAVAFVIGSIFSFLNVFKLDHLTKNFERKTFQRYKASLDDRSDKWMKAYIKFRLAEVEDEKIKPGERKNLLFRADKVDTDNPLTDWYKTMRTSAFEDDLLEKHGIRFVSVVQTDSKGRESFRSGKIVIDQKNLPNPLTDAQLKQLKAGTITLDELDDILKKYIRLEVYDTKKIARKEIKRAVSGVTHDWQVIKRRHVRKNIQNVTGVTDWRFFEKTRDKIDEKVFNVRNKIVKKAMPQNTITGKYIQCLLGVSNCKASTDPADPENRSETARLLAGEKDNKRGTLPDDPDNPDIDKDAASRLYREAMEKIFSDVNGELAIAGIKMAIIKQILAKINIGTAVLSIIDMLARIDGAIKDGALTKMVTVARGSQALGFYQTYMTASDQLRTGEVTGPEVGKFMETINSASNSEGWVDVIAHNGEERVKAEEEEFKPAKNRAEYCGAEHQTAIQQPKYRKISEKKDFHYLCGDKQIGGTSRAKQLEDWWEKTFGLVLGPLLSFYRATGIGKVISWINKVVDVAIGWAVDGIIKALGLGDTIEAVVSWALTEVASFLGAGPMMNGTEPSGVFINTIIQGGSYGAEASARFQGAAKTTQASANLARQNTVAYQNYQNESASIFEKYFSLQNDQSATSQTIFASVQDSTVNNISGIFSKFVKNLSKIPMQLFSGSARAVKDDPYAASKFSGIDTYDFPKQCMDLDIVKMKPADVTNADNLKDPDGNPWIPAGDLTWDLVNNNITFYDTLYEHIYEHYENNADDIAAPIYNCALLDTTIRGGLGAVYGYTADNGLEDYAATNINATQNAINNKVYVLGNSLTVGMHDAHNFLSPELKNKKWDPKINGVSGRQLVDGADSGLNQAKKDKRTIKQVGAIVIELGTNGCGNSTAKFTQDLEQLYNYLKGVNEDAEFYWQNFASTKVCKEVINQRNQDLQKFASTRNITIIDWSAIGTQYTSGDTMGLHPNKTGYKKMSELIGNALGVAPNTDEPEDKIEDVD